MYVSVVSGSSRQLGIKPKYIHLFSNENLYNLKWISWGGETATATGMDHSNFPSPGHKASNPVRVTATDRRRCRSKLVYTTIRLHFTQGVPYSGQPRNPKDAYGCMPY